MSLINCKKCGVLFQKRLRDICDKCLEKDNLTIDKIEKYIRNCSEQFITFEMIKKATGVESEEIEEFYKKGRLSIITGRLTTKCKICGVEIKGVQGNSNFCVKCSSEVISEDGAKKAMLDSKNANIELRRFDNDIIHSNKVIPPDERTKYGFKKNYE
ncbi:MAG: hypothetical protein PHC34_10925 [Candidatus Gastranaerophilales bacterium]|nr:hypothetical protein [Candidatus Gastranaerophilales bacterium]